MSSEFCKKKKGKSILSNAIMIQLKLLLCYVMIVFQNRQKIKTINKCQNNDLPFHDSLETSLHSPTEHVDVLARDEVCRT